jgi:hypothetical protein
MVCSVPEQRSEMKVASFASSGGGCMPLFLGGWETCCSLLHSHRSWLKLRNATCWCQICHLTCTTFSEPISTTLGSVNFHRLSPYETLPPFTLLPMAFPLHISIGIRAKLCKSTATPGIVPPRNNRWSSLPARVSQNLSSLSLCGNGAQS